MAGFGPWRKIGDNAVMTDRGYQWYQRYRPWKRRVEIGAWVAFYAVMGAFNSVTALMDVRRSDLPYAAWEPVVWESSSALASLALIPLVAWFSGRLPLFQGPWRRAVAAHLAGSIAFCLAHVGLMVALRHASYGLAGGQYDFGHWPTELFYEYLKDARSYFGMVVIMEVYRAFMRRLRGEARLLDAPDDAPPSESVDRPERFLVRMLGREFLVSAGDIEWAAAAGNYVNLHVRERDYPLRSTLSAVEQRLDPTRFLRVHRSYVVNLDRIAEIEPLESGDARVRMHGGMVLPASRRYRQELRERFGG